VAFVFVLALILDGGRVYAERRKAQNAADAAATAGAAALNHNNPAASLLAVQNAACKAAFDNGYGSGVPDAACGPAGTIIQIHVPGASDGASQLTNVANAFETTGYVQVAVTARFTSFIQSWLGGGNLAASALAVAANIPSAGLGYGLLVLNPADCASFVLNGNNTRVTLHNGGAMVDSAAKKSASPTCSSKDAAVSNGLGSQLLTDAPFQNRVVGSGDAMQATPAFINDSDFVVDPLAYVHVPDYGQNGNTYVPNTTHPTVAGQPAKLNGACTTNPSLCPEPWDDTTAHPFPNPMPPGVFWGGIKVGNNKVLILQGGTYIMAGGGLNISGGSVFALAPVTIIMTNDKYCNTANAGNCGQNGLKSNGNLYLSGSQVGQDTGTTNSSWGWIDPAEYPDPDPNISLCEANSVSQPTACQPVAAPASNADGEDFLDHILIYIDRDAAPCDGAVTFKAGGGGSYYFATGSIVYAPCSTVALWGTADPFVPHAGAVDAYNVAINGGKTLELGGPGPNPPARPKTNLVQ
jgi:hypothetical protein